MFYQYSDELTTIEPQDRDPNLVCAAYITLAELDAHYEKVPLLYSSARRRTAIFAPILRCTTITALAP